MSPPSAQTTKNIVIIGASSGVALARDLAKSLPSTHRVILIEKNEFAYFPIAGPRAAVVPGKPEVPPTLNPYFGWEAKVWSRVDVFPDGSRHIVLVGTEVVGLGEDHVKVDVAHPEYGFTETIPFQYAVVATGSSCSLPGRPLASNGDKLTSELRKMQDDVKDARSILVVGGGPVGVETVGEIVSAYKGKKVTVVHGGSELVGLGANVHKRLMKEMEASGVEVILDDRITSLPGGTGPVQDQVFTTTKGRRIEADYVVLAIGGKPNSGLVADADLKAVNGAGQVKVDDTLKIKSTNLSRYFALGDVNDVQEWKMVANAWRQASVIKANIMSSIASGQASKQYKVGSVIMAVTFGPKSGIIHTPWMTLGGTVTSMLKSSSMLTDKFHTQFRPITAKEDGGVGQSSVMIPALVTVAAIGAAYWYRSTL